ncbi:general secretion pathway protein D [Kaistia hirudinis]|uniref:General secretion pathway protein D n=1 Tax=Kaistia hirudinis TaxID=1293440 RepID=A0A840AI60_9HYPH|nr:type II secretion system secretin GspD [Kaistia hirudinis]MBB3930039.1 general secretion pathway protein D [Kaistia hirudinis]
MGVAFVAALLTACTALGEADDEGPNANRFLGDITGSLSPNGLPKPASFDRSPQNGAPRGYSDYGSSTPMGAVGGQTPRGITDDGQRFSINFADVSVQDFVRSVFEEVLHENVVVDTGITGRVTVRTATPVSKTAAIDLIKSVLSGVGASLTEANGVYRVSQRGGGDPQSGGQRSFRAFQLKFIDAEQAKGALQAFNSEGASMSSIAGGRVLVATGSEVDLDRFQQVLQTLDIDQMRQRSFALVPLREAGAASVAGELNTMFKSEDAKGFQALPVERMNAVLLLGTSQTGIQRARQWISHLDQAGADERRVNVYPVQNRRATELAGVLQQMIGSGGGSGAIVAAGLKEKTVTADAGMGGAQIAGQEATVAVASSGSQGSGLGGADGIAISADPSTNSLVVVATPDDYRVIEKAIRRLDVLPTQVLIEATILEVTLNDKLRHGVRWYFESGNNAVMLTDASGKSVSPILPGFSYIYSAPGARAVVDALEDMTKVEVISSPALTVLDNQTATLKVGDQVPIATRSAVSVTDPQAPIVNDIEMKDTGVILSVKPRVNANGLVQLDISQEISDVVQTTTSAIDSPTIRQRAVTSSVVVQGGTEIILGGMISAKRERTRSGVPILMNIPIVGEAFTSNAIKDAKRTELLIMIRPVVMTSTSDVSSITQEIRSRMMASPLR